ncbi:hypothetical protein, partial [Pseudomonas sp. WSY_20]|uniref:hypothetical protein n=1 Tax=Pseudomonas sp. WSY_20 TaxID=3367212 RepID=UPI00370C40B1
ATATATAIGIEHLILADTTSWNVMVMYYKKKGWYELAMPHNLHLIEIGNLSHLYGVICLAPHSKANGFRVEAVSPVLRP